MKHLTQLIRTRAVNRVGVYLWTKLDFRWKPNKNRLITFYECALSNHKPEKCSRVTFVILCSFIPHLIWHEGDKYTTLVCMSRPLTCIFYIRYMM